MLTEALGRRLLLVALGVLRRGPLLAESLGLESSWLIQRRRWPLAEVGRLLLLLCLLLGSSRRGAAEAVR